MTTLRPYQLQARQAAPPDRVEPWQVWQIGCEPMLVLSADDLALVDHTVVAVATNDNERAVLNKPNNMRWRSFLGWFKPQPREALRRTWVFTNPAGAVGHWDVFLCNSVLMVNGATDVWMNNLLDRANNIWLPLGCPDSADIAEWRATWR